ncbi:MAG: ABC transporter ATP-binding protein [Gammaproteobacteria bacterium]|nr:ABC transporter ATP-binding protein [Gammaproteobacteria bacterium]
MQGPELVRLRGVSRSYLEGERSRAVLSDLSAEFSRGEFVAVVGPSGCGKSTLLNLISGIDRPDAGSIEIDGRTVTALAERERTVFRRSYIGFIYQSFNLIPTLTVLENVCLPLALNGHRPPHARDQAQAMLTQVGLSDRDDSYPDVLSGGEQQRIALARALVHKPRLILADEPTGNLDADSGARIAALLGSLVRAAGATLILVTHSEQLAALADRVLVMSDGRLRPA